VLNIWVDEAYSLETSGSLARALASETGHPPGYFVLLFAWRQVASSLFFARLSSVACTALTLFLLARASRRYLPRLPEGWVAAVAAWHPLTLWAATEARPYALVMLLSASLLVLLHKAFISEQASRGARLAYGGVACLALYTQYYLGFLLAANLAALVGLRRWRAARDYLLWMLPVGFACAPLALMIGGHIAVQAQATLPVPLPRAVKWVLILLEGFVSSLDFLPNEGLFLRNLTVFDSGGIVRWSYRLAILLLMFTAHRTGLRGRGRLEPGLLALGGILLAQSALFVAVTAALGGPLAEARHSVSLFVPALLVFFAVFSPGRPRAPLAVAMGLLLLSNAAAAYADFAPLAKRGDHARVGAYVAGAEASGQPIFVFPSESAAPFAYDYRGRNRIVPLPAPPKAWNPADFAFSSETQVAQALEQGLGGARECWLFTEHVEIYDEVPLRVDLLESVVAERFTLLEKRHFYGARLRKLRRREAPAAAPP
jgi:hypothetical protein